MTWPNRRAPVLRCQRRNFPLPICGRGPISPSRGLSRRPVRRSFVQALRHSPSEECATVDGGRFSISADVLSQCIGVAAPIVIDSRRAPAFDGDGWIIVGGICCPPDAMGAWQRERTDKL